METYRAIAWIGDRLRLMDQRVLPHEVTYIDYEEFAAVADGIRTMVVRGAPAIGITAAYGMVLAARQSAAANGADVLTDLAKAGDVLRAARPTAVNLGWAIDRILQRVGDQDLTDPQAVRDAVLVEAAAIEALEKASNYQIGANALPLVPQGARIIHHCNTGPLATGDYGTALRVITAAHEAGK